MQRQVFDSDHGLVGNFAIRIGAIAAMTAMLLLSACDVNRIDVTDHNLPEPGSDGIPPALTSVTVKMSRDRDPKPDGTVQLGQSVRIDIQASEGLKTPVVTINDVAAMVQGSVNNWFAEREMTENDTDGEIYFSIDYEDISGEVGASVNTTTDGSAVLFCAEGCPETGNVTLAGDWRLDGVDAAGVGPAPGDISWWSTTAEIVAERDCFFNDVFRFGSDGSFRNVPGDDTWLEAWQGSDPEACGAPVAPHDGSSAGTWVYDETAGLLTIDGTGSHLGLAKAVNGEELTSPANAPASVMYQVQTLDAETLTVAIETAPGSWWTFRFAREPESPLVGKWVLDGEGAAGVGPAAEDISWWNTTADIVAERDCWFDDIYEFNADGSFRNIQGDETWLEAWQGADPEACGAPVAPHDGSNGAIYQYDEDASTLKLSGRGAFLGLGKAVNGEELLSPSSAPESITYDVTVLDGDSMTVTVESGDSVWWTFRLARLTDSPLTGKWKLAGEGAAGVGPAAGDTSWWNTTADIVAARDCWFDDTYHFGADGSFQNYQGEETWLEAWQGADPEACGAPVAPHDGSSAGSFSYDEAAGTLLIDGRGSFLGLPKAVNGQELASPGDAPDSVTYDVLTLDGDNLSIAVEAGDGVWWTFVLERVNDTAALSGMWKLDGEGAAGVGPAPGDISWFSTTADVVAERDCLFDDVFDFAADGSFSNEQGSETWLEAWQGSDPEACGAPVAPHDGSGNAIFEYDEAASTLTIHGTGAHLGLAKAVNGEELASPSAAPVSVTYDVLTLDGDSMTVAIESGDGIWWTFNLARASNSQLAGNWKLDGEDAAGVGPAEGDISWWSTTADVVAARECLFDDVYHFGASGSFQNFQDGETWLEAWQGTDPEACGAPVAPHDGSSAGSYSYDDAAGTLTILGRGSFLGLAKAVNGAELSDPGAAPDSVSYSVLTLDAGSITVAVDSGDGVFWTFRLAKE